MEDPAERDKGVQGSRVGSSDHIRKRLDHICKPREIFEMRLPTGGYMTFPFMLICLTVVCTGVEAPR
jgi:hypothetical protein